MPTYLRQEGSCNLFHESIMSRRLLIVTGLRLTISTDTRKRYPRRLLRLLCARRGAYSVSNLSTSFLFY